MTAEPACERTPPDDTTAPVTAEGSYDWWRAEVARRDEELERLRAELAEARAAIGFLADDGDVNELLRPVVAERDALKAAIESARAYCDELMARCESPVGIPTILAALAVPESNAAATVAVTAATEAHGGTGEAQEARE